MTVSKARKPKLRFRTDGTFTIAQLTDIHWHNGEPEDLSSRALIEAVLEAERPDLVAFTGDVVGGYASHDPDEALRQAVAPVERRRVPWAMVFGNHDDEGRLSRLDLLRAQQALSSCLSERGPESVAGVGNYVLRISSARARALGAALYFLDSGGYAAAGPGHYAWIGRDQIAWYVRRARSLAAEYARAPAYVPRAERLPALAFFHLPLPEYVDAWDFEPCRGSRGEPVCCPALNSGLFAALVESGDVMGTFVGHDHLNDFEGERHGIRLCYGRAGGFSS